MKGTKTIAAVIMAMTVTMIAACGNKAGEDSKTTTSTAEPTIYGTLTIKVGDVSVSWIKDNTGDHLMSPSLFEEASDSIIEALGLSDGIPSTVSAFLVETGSDTILFDTGLGEVNGGQLINRLATLGLQASDIKLIYLTHYHNDHIGGLLDPAGERAFPNAEVYVSRTEHEAWMAMPADKTEAQCATVANYVEQLRLFAPGDTLPGGVITIDAAGHTPGHTAFQIDSLLIIGDLIHGAALQLDNPELCPSYDMDKEAATASRRRLLDYARKNSLTMAGMHLPVPAFLYP